MPTMVEIFWTLQAQNDLRELGKYLAGESSIYAESLLNAIYNAVGRLAQAPASGTALRQRGSMREIAIGNYRVVYSLQGGVITVLVVALKA